MILQSLADYYHRLLDSDGDTTAGEGFSSEKIHYALVINKKGSLIQVLDLRESKGRKKIPKNIIVPEPVKKSVNIEANFLWGNTSYVLGSDDKGKPERTAKCHEFFKDLHNKLLQDCNDEGAKAVLAFLSSWEPKDTQSLDDRADLLKCNLAFKVEGDLGFVHERPAIKNLWMQHLLAGKKGTIGMCLISGQMAPIARLHASIKGVGQDQRTLVSFNKNAFWSYGKEQSYNAPVSQTSAAAYTKALNQLLSNDSHRVQIADATTVFWTERDSPVEGFFGMIIRDTSADDRELAVFLKTVREGKWPAQYDANIRFYILGLVPNRSRLSVRFWHASTVKDISEKLGQHFRDLSMVRSFDSDPEYPGMWRLLKETSNSKSKDGPSPLLAGAVMQAILKGTPYPQNLLSAVIGRIRAEQNINYLRAAIIKAVLVRKNRIQGQNMEVPMTLDKENKNPAYLLGRLFAVLEKAQQVAIPGANTTIKNRFYGSASATPRVVFPQLLRLAQHWIEKAEYGKLWDKKIEEIVCDMQEFPAHLDLDEQGLFAIGYYHQRQDFFKKNNN